MEELIHFRADAQPFGLSEHGVDSDSELCPAQISVFTFRQQFPQEVHRPLQQVRRLVWRHGLVCHRRDSLARGFCLLPAMLSLTVLQLTQVTWYSTVELVVL
jgi:hypothetical protein